MNLAEPSQIAENILGLAIIGGFFWMVYMSWKNPKQKDYLKNLLRFKKKDE